MPRKQNWYNLQEQRNYPIDDAATGVDDDGRFVPQDILADAAIKYSRDVGGDLYVAGITVTPGIVTVLFAAEVESGGFAPVAAITLPQPVVPYQLYAVEAMSPGAVGWVAFGAGVKRQYAGRFSSSAQTRLLARCGSAYRPPPVTSINKATTLTALSGIVTLKPGPDIAITPTTLFVDGSFQRAIVVSLANSLNRNVYDLYAGPCKSRPESDNCLKVPLRSVGGVSPDCDGNVDIEFRGLRATPFSAGGGVTIDLGVGIGSVCGDPSDDYDPLPRDTKCDGHDGDYQFDGSEYTHPVFDDNWNDGPVDPDCDASVGGATACSPPVHDNFQPTCSGPVIIDGTWGTETVVVPPSLHDPGGPSRRVFVATSYSRRSTAVWDYHDCPDPGLDSLGKTYEVAAFPKLGGSGCNGGVVFGWRSDGQPHASYYLALANVATGSAELWRFDNSRWTLLKSQSSTDAMPGDSWYSVGARPFVIGGTVSIKVAVRGMVGLFTPITFTHTMPVADYGVSIGGYGLGTKNAACKFAYMDLQLTGDP